MTVAELIEKLREFDPSELVFITDGSSIDGVEEADDVYPTIGGICII
jgi:hypothetical protein